MTTASEAKMIIFTAPSGAGKTTIVRHLMEKYPQLGFSISATTRPKRPHETDGKDYHFMSIEDFREKIHDGAFAEFEEVYPGQYYGTLKSEITRLAESGKTAIFDIDVKGADNLKRTYGDQCLCVFVRPPSIQALIDRLRNRKTESEESFRKRIQKAKFELTYENRFDEVLVNDILEVALKDAEYLVEDFLNITEDAD
jgi:guanylate kinase